MEGLEFIQQFITLTGGFGIALICFFIILATFIFKMLLKERLGKLKKKTRAIIIIGFAVIISLIFSIVYTYFTQNEAWYFMLFHGIKNTGLFAFLSVMSYDGVKDKINLFLRGDNAKDVTMVQKK